MTHSSHASPATVAGVADYIVVVSNEDDFHAGFHHFADKVNRKLRAGYQLHGQPFSVCQTICQAMVRHGDAPGGEETMTYLKPSSGYHS
jgi:hypothetical protein